MNCRSVGTKYEQIASEYLVQQGYFILEKNYRCPMGEIDLICRKDETICFVEIKYRTSTTFGSAIEAVNAKKQRKICQVASYYWMCHSNYEGDSSFRFDVIGIDGQGEIRHVINAFSYRN